MKKILYFCSLFFLISQISYSIDLVGSSIMLPIAQKVGELYTQSNKIPVSYRGIGSPFGISNAKNGGLGIVSRELTSEEKKDGLIAIPIAYTTYIFVINKNNSIKKLSLEQVYKIYAGVYKNWKEVGGTDLSIIIAGTNENHASFAFLLDAFHIEKYPKNYTGYQTYRKILSQISLTDGAIGYVGKSWVSNLSNEVNVKTLKINSANLSKVNILNGNKIFSRTMNFVIKKSAINDEMRNLIKFFYTKAAMNIIREEGFTPIFLDLKKYPFLNNKNKSF